MQAAELRNDPFRRITVTPYTGTFGAEISDVDLNNIDEETTAEIREALLRYNVVFFQGQEFTPESQAAFVRRFGTLNRHPYVKGIDGHPDVFRIVKEPTDKHHFGNGWHTDLAYTENPAMGTVLYGMEVPQSGGDTMYCSTVAAYEALDEGFKELLEGRKAIYTNAHTYGANSKRFQTGVSKAMNVTPAEIKEVAHPVVRTHPETGKKGLYLSVIHFSHFEGMSPEQSKPLYDTLMAHATKPEFTLRFRWKTGSVAFWDNRCTMHYAVDDRIESTRVMQRVTLEGDRPF